MKKTNIYFSETEDVIDIRRDNVFKAVFARNNPTSKGALSKLISALIYKEVKIVTINTNEPPIDNIKDRQIRFDINCKAKSGELINVEMSLNPDLFEPVRLEFYAGKLFTAQDIKGIDKKYDDLKQAYQITILDKEKFFKDEDFFHSFEYYDPIRGVSLNGKSRIVTLELSKLVDIVEKPVDEMNIQEYWAIFLKYLTDKSKRGKINKIIELNEGIAMASKAVKWISKDEIERFRLMSEEKYELDKQSLLVTAERKARREGEQRGMKKGILKGRQEVIQEKQKIIDLLKSGKSPEEILKEFDK